MTCQRGVSLIELVAVITILGIVAAVTVPTLFSGNSKKVDVAATELADAIRFTRAEAIRTTSPTGIWYFSSTPGFSLYRVTYLLGLPIPVYDVRHPIDKKLYTLNYSNNGNQAPVTISSVTLKYGGSGSNREYIAFDSHGTPRYLDGSTYKMLDEATIVLVYDGHTRTVSVSPMTGRVTVQ